MTLQPFATGRSSLARWLQCATVLAATAASAAAWAATTTTFTAVADAKVSQAAPTTNYATVALQTQASTTSAALESYLRFTVSGISGSVTLVKLRVYTTTTAADGPGAYATTSTWTETGLTWNNRPAAAGAMLADVAATTKNTYVEWTIPATVTGNGDYSFILRNQATTALTFNSRESASNKPQLVVTFSDPQCDGKPNGTTCTDGNACTTGDACSNNVCVSGAALTCNDGNACTADTCNTATGCVFTTQTGTSCNIDNNACTADTCNAGTCTPGGALVCNDNNACTDDTCNSTSGCVFVNNSAPCNKDNNPCTLDACSAGACAVGPNSKCDDGNGCTNDTCNSTTGACTYSSPDANCGTNTVLPFGSAWKYLVKSSALASGWAAAGYSETGWSSGAAPLGYGVTPLGTTIGYGGNAAKKYITTYFRKSFYISKPTDYPQLTLTIKKLHGAVVYLNGAELYRTDMNLGTFSYSTVAPNDATGDDLRTFAIPNNKLLAGSNQLAVELHQWSASAPTLSLDVEVARKCTIPIGDPAIEAFETKCDGLDNDCDGNTDLLMPYGANVCTTGGSGACSTGVSACLDGAKVCITPPATAESKNGIDDDCDGTVDNLPTLAAKSAQIRILMPNAMWTDSPTYAQGIIEMLEMSGVPYYALDKNSPSVSTDWYTTGFDTLAQYPVVVIPGYLDDTILAAWQIQKLTDYANAGGIVVVFKPLGTAAGAMAGLTSFTNLTTAKTLRMTNNVPATWQLEAVEERDFLLSKDPSFSPVSLYTFGVDAAANVTVWGRARDGATDLGAVMTRKPMSNGGAIYALGFDPLSYTWMKCYVNCFDPGRDILVAMFKGWLREGMRGHFANKHSSPSTGAGMAVISHDIDAPDSHNSGGEWGEAGAIQMAKAEQARSVKGSYMITTDYVTGYNNATLPTSLCNLGMCPVGGHSVQHLIGKDLPLGDCTVTKATYVTSSPTICGETIVNLDMLKGEIPGTPLVRSWRCPYLSVHPNQFDVLHQKLVDYDSSYAMGDTRSNFPLKADRWPYMDHVFNHNPLWELPIVQEDGKGDVTNGVTTRVELQVTNQQWFLNNWYYAALKNQANGAWNVTLVHPSWGVGVGPENVPYKIDTVAKYIDLIKPAGLYITDMTSATDWWKARDQVKLVVNFASATGYSGTITTGALAITGFSIEFSDNIGTFSCSGGAATVANRRAVLTGTLAANTTYTFTATVAP